MPSFEYITPAASRLRDLCTNGLFLNLREFPDPLKITYQHLRDQIRDGRFTGACLALTDMAFMCLRFPALIACALVYRMEAPKEDKDAVFAHFHSFDGLSEALTDFLRHHPNNTAMLFAEALADARDHFQQNGLWDWCLRPASGCLLEINRAEAASELITYVGVLNQYLRQVLRFYPHVKELPDHDILTFDCLGNVFSPEPFLFRHSDGFYLTEALYPSSHCRLCREVNTVQLQVFDAPEDLCQYPLDSPDTPSANLAEQLSCAYQPTDYLRPAYWDRWLHQALTEHPGGYLLLEADANMGKSVYTSLLDPASPYYMESSIFENVDIYRYAVSLYPDTHRPSYFVRALNRFFPNQEPILFTEKTPDLRRRIAEALNTAARRCAPRKLLLIMDGMQHLDCASSQSFSLPQILPSASQLLPNVYILLTDRCASADASHRDWLLTKDPVALIGTFTKNFPQHQQLFRVYLTQYVLHVNGEDNPLVSTLAERMKGDLALAHSLRDVLTVCRPDAYTNALDFFNQYPSCAELHSLYLDRLCEMYGPVHSPLIHELLRLFALSPNPLTLQRLWETLADKPSTPVLWTLLRDLRPILTFHGSDRIGIASTTLHYLTLSLYAHEWPDYCVRLMTQRKNLPASPEDLDYYAKSIGWQGHEELLTQIAGVLLPKQEQDEPLSQSVVDYFQALGEFFPDETINPFRLDTLLVLSLSPSLNDRRIACGRWESLQGTPLMDPEQYARSCQLYVHMLSLQDPLCASTIEALAAFRRKTESLSKDSFLWHTEKLHRGRILEALRNPDAFSNTSDPCSLSWVHDRLPELIRLAEEDLLNPLPQECAVLTHLLVPFCENYLRALLSVLCARDMLTEAGALFEWIRGQLLRVYRCRTHLFGLIDEYSHLLLPDANLREPLYAPDPMEAVRAPLLEKDLRLWLQTFPERQLLQYYRDNTPLWRVEEAILRLESIHRPAAREYSVNPRTIRAQIASTEPEQALALADQWYLYVCALLTSSRGAIPAGRSNDLCAVQLVRAQLLARLRKNEELHACVAQLRFFLDHGALSSRRTLDTVCALGTSLLAEDTLQQYSSPQELVDLYAQFNARLQKSRSFLTARQIAYIQGQLKESFPKCMLSQRFYHYIIPAQARIASQQPSHADPASIQDPAEHLVALLAMPDRDSILSWLYSYLPANAPTMPPALLDYCVSLALELRPDHFAPLIHSLYELWLRFSDHEMALVGLDGNAPSQEKLLYRRVAGCFLTEGAVIDPQALQGRIFAQLSCPEHRAFALLCAAIYAGARCVPAAGELARLGSIILKDPCVSQLSLALELTKLELLALCLDEASSLSGLADLADRWIDLLWMQAIARENNLSGDARILRTPDGHFTSVPPQPISISARILEDCIGSDARVSSRLPFRLYARLWNTPLSYPVPETLPEYLQNRLQENWNQLS